MKKKVVSKISTSSKKNNVKKIKSKVATTKKRINKPKLNNIEPKINKNNKRNPLKIILVFFITGILISLIYLLLTLSYFNVMNFVVEGNSKYTTEEIYDKSGLKKGDNIFLQIFSGYKKNIAELPYIEKINLSIKFPNEIKLKVIERKSIYLAYDKEKNRFFKIDASGYILEKSDINLKTTDELLIFGITFDDEVILGNKISYTDISKLNIYNEIAQKFKESGINGNITKANFENSLTTITINDKLNVIFPNNTNLKYNMSFLVGILAKIGEDAVGIIDMTKTNPILSSF